MNWLKKYAPKSFEEVAGNKKVVQALKKYVEQGDMPHLIFHGHRGTGKNTLAVLLAKAMLGNSWRENFKEMNASDERTIDIVRQQIIPYMRHTGLWNFNSKFKILFLDEADAITPDAQQALKRPLEIYEDNCKVIFSCNNIDRIIPEIQDRCDVYAFPPLKKKDIVARLNYILQTEGIADGIDVEKIAEEANGSMRKAIILLQRAVLTMDSEMDEIEALLEKYVR